MDGWMDGLHDSSADRLANEERVWRLRIFGAAARKKCVIRARVMAQVPCSEQSLST